MARAILVIDVQKVYTDPTSPLHCMGNAAAIDNINAIVTRGRAAGDLIVQVRHLHRADGSDAGRMFDFTGDATEIGFVEGTTEAEDDPRLALEPASLTIHKQRYSCFVGTGLDDALRARGVDTIVVTGFITNFCCEATARHGHDLDYFVEFPMDATGCSDLSETATQAAIKNIAAASLGAGYARVMTTAELLARM